MANLTWSLYDVAHEAKFNNLINKTKFMDLYISQTKFKNSGTHMSVRLRPSPNPLSCLCILARAGRKAHGSLWLTGRKARGSLWLTSHLELTRAKRAQGVEHICLY